MTSAPIFPPTDVSTPNRLTTDTMPGTIPEFQNVVSLPPYGSYDDMLNYEFWVDTITWDESFANKVFRVTLPDMVVQPAGMVTALQYILGSHDYIDYDLEVIIRAYKQERARGKIRVKWYPNIEYHDDDYFFDRVTYQVWDLEATEDYCIECKGPKDMAWRSMTDGLLSVKANDKIQTYYVEDTESNKGTSTVLGTISFAVGSKFQKGVGPDKLQFAVYVRVKNPNMSQYRRFVGKEIMYLPGS